MLVECSKLPARARPVSTLRSVYHHPKWILRKSSVKSVKKYFSSTVWQLRDSISNNILMVFLMVISYPKIVYPLPINWIKSSCTIEWE